MKRATIMLGLGLALTCAFTGVASSADATPTAVVRVQALDGAVLTELNVTRAAHGLRPLKLSGQLERAAVAHSREMLDGGFFGHDSPRGPSFVQRLKRFYPASGYRSWSAGENLIYNRSAIDAHVALRAWLDSSPHRENMLDPSWREVGVGSLHASSAGGTFAGRPTWVITIDFGARTGPVVKTAVGVVQKTDDTKAHAKQTTRLRRSMPA